jgi:signal transduction histidine kinase
VKDSDIHETPTTIRLDAFIVRMIRSARLAGHEVQFVESGLTVLAKPLALKRAVGNLLDNALRYGEKTEIHVEAASGCIEIRIRDHGPGVPEDVLDSLCQPYVRLEHGKEKNGEGLGLGLDIVRGIVHSLGGELILANHPEGGLCATIRLPAKQKI